MRNKENSLYLIEGNNAGMSPSQTMRHVFADALRQDPEKYKKVFTSVGNLGVKIYDSSAKEFKEFSNLTRLEQKRIEFVSGAAKLAIMEHFDYQDNKEYFRLVQKNEKLGKQVKFEEMKTRVFDRRAYVSDTYKEKENGTTQNGFLDKLVNAYDSVSMKTRIGIGTAVTLPAVLAACYPAAEVAPLNEAVLSGVISQESADKLTGSSKIIVEKSLAFIGNKYAEDENFVSGTEMIYAVAKGTDSFAYYLAGFKNKDGSVGMKVTDFCPEWLRDNENCQNIGEDLRMVEGGGNRIYGFVDKNNKQHPILLIDKNNNPVAFDLDGSSYAERVANSQGFVDKIVSIGAMNVQAAPEATARATATLPVAETPTATATKEPTATETVIVKEFPDPEMVEFDRTTLTLNGNRVEFVIGTEEESNALDIWGELGIEALIINKNLPDYQEKFSKLMLASFWQNTGQEITYEEYLSNIDNYPIVFKSRQINGRIFEKSCNVKDIKKIEYRILTNPEDPRIYLKNSNVSNIPLGFNYFENGTLTIYQLTRDGFIDNAISMIDWGGGKDAIGVKEMLGDQVGLGFPITMLSFPYTMVAGSQGNILMNDVVDRMEIVSDVSGYPYQYNGSDYFRYIKDHGFWSVILK